MRLKNKKTGEIIEKYPDRFVINSGEQIRQYNSLAELNSEWEDAPEEPEEDGFDHIINLVEAYSTADDKFYPKEIVEKLKAWKRLKDKGFKFNGWGLLEYGGCDRFDYSPRIGFSIPNLDKDEPYEYPEEIEKDLDLLFSGGEE